MSDQSSCLLHIQMVGVFSNISTLFFFIKLWVLSLNLALLVQTLCKLLINNLYYSYSIYHFCGCTLVYRLLSYPVRPLLETQNYHISYPSTLGAWPIHEPLVYVSSTLQKNSQKLFIEEELLRQFQFFNNKNNFHFSFLMKVT